MQAGDRDQALFEFVLRLGDSTLILGHRLSEWCGHGPMLEEDIAMANVALDLIGQTQMWLGLAASVAGKGQSADDLAYHRDAMDFRNLLLVEQPNGDFATTIIRQYLFDAWHVPLLDALAGAGDPRIAEIAAKAVKEARYHRDRSADLVIRLGDGSAESHARMQSALDTLWPFTGEMFETDEIEAALPGIAPDATALRGLWDQNVQVTLATATLTPPINGFARSGGRVGRHSEHLGYILAEMQFLQRAYPGAEW